MIILFPNQHNIWNKSSELINHQQRNKKFTT